MLGPRDVSGFLKGKRGNVRRLCRGTLRDTRCVGARAGGHPGVTIILNSNLNGLATSFASARRLSCGSVPGFPMSAITKRGNTLLTNGLKSARICTVRNHFRFCRNCSVGRIYCPFCIFGLLNIRGIILAGTYNNVGQRFTPNALVLVASFVGVVNAGPLVNPGSRHFNPHFPSVARPCDLRLQGLTGRATSRLNVTCGRNICVNFVNPYCRATTRVHTFTKVKTSTINVDAIPRAVIYGCVNVGMLTIDYVAGVTANVRAIGRDRTHILRVTGRTNSALYQ